MDWFTLRLLADDWAAALAGARIADAWTQAPRELSLLVETPGGETSTLRLLCDPALTVAFRAPGGGRQKRNTADALPGLAGRTVRLVRAADRDRVLHLHLHGGEQLVATLFGPRPNVFRVAADGTVRDAFLRAADWTDREAPTGRPAPDPATPDAVAARWPTGVRTLAQAVRRAAPLLPAALAADAVRAAGLDPDAATPEACPDALAESVAELRARLESPSMHVAWRGEIAEALLPVALLHPPAGWTQEAFSGADGAVRVWARRSLAQARFTTRFRPLESALASAAGRRERAAEAMLAELSQPSRADRYEAWGHLLMASAAGQPAGAETVTVPDLLGDGAPVEIPLDEARTAVENAERYYDRARTARRARASAEARWEAVHDEAERTADLLARLRAVDTLPALDALLADEADAIAALVRPEATGGATEPFRRVALPDGWTALVGRNAKQNANLTTHVARPHDLWLHARGVPGSHVVVPRASKTAAVPEHVVRAAAAVAAQYSEAKTQAVVPVTVTERKYVRPVKGGAPGLVRVERERVVDVAPGEA